MLGQDAGLLANAYQMHADFFIPQGIGLCINILCPCGWYVWQEPEKLALQTDSNVWILSYPSLSYGLHLFCITKIPLLLFSDRVEQSGFILGRALLCCLKALDLTVAVKCRAGQNSQVLHAGFSHVVVMYVANPTIPYGEAWSCVSDLFVTAVTRTKWWVWLLPHTIEKRI